MNTIPPRNLISESATSEISLWEAAYSRFETPKEEIRKFRRRLNKLGVENWSREANVVELFCGRGSGLEALAELGFRHLEGVDLSPRLLAQYHGFATCYVADCRQLPFADCSKDILIVQGGLHHLSVLPEDLDQVLSEARRVLRQSGRCVVVEPWLTPFLRFVHASCGQALCRQVSSRLDALATMIEYERHTYEQWLAAPDLIMALFRSHFELRQLSTTWGKLSFVGSPRPIDIARAS
jgi:ubiquinone/menaquinone biosynthesis C-methylase UbiE